MSVHVERFPMQANFEGLIHLLAKNLYPEPDVFVRELIQNAHDSIRLRQEQEPEREGRIEVEVRPEESLILFRDNGMGMDRDEIKRFLSVIGSTGTGTAISPWRARKASYSCRAENLDAKIHGKWRYSGI